MTEINEKIRKELNEILNDNLNENLNDNLNENLNDNLNENLNDISSKKIITDLDELFIEINKNFCVTKSLEHCKNLLAAYDGDDWKQYVEFSDTHYKRNHISKNTNDYLEFVLICWLPDQGSIIHDHPENGCLVKVIQGVLREDIYVSNDDESYTYTHTINNERGNISYMEKSSIVHKISNPTIMPSVSLHVYSPPKFKHTVCKTTSC